MVPYISIPRISNRYSFNAVRFFAFIGLVLSASSFTMRLAAQSIPLMLETNGTQLNYQNTNYSIPTYEAAGGFDSDAPEGSYRYQGTGTVQRTYGSTGYYPNASGASNVFLNFGATFIISNITPKASTNNTIHISFGLYKSKVSVNNYPNGLPKLEYATNYAASSQTGTFKTTSIVNINNNSGWQQVDAYINVPANVTLALRFTNRSGTNGDNSKIQYRIDDVQMEYMDCSTAPIPSLTFTSGGVISCQNQAIALNVTNSYSYPVTYAWANISDTATILSTASSIAIPSGSPGSASYRVRVTGTYDVCPKSASQAITIRPAPSASMSRSAASICQGSAASITFSGSNGTAPYIFSYSLNGGALQSVTSTGSTSTISAPNTNAQTNTFLLASVQDANCTASLASATDITVLANHAISLSSAANSNSQTVCVNAPIAALNYTLSGGATGASVSGLPSGLSASVSGNILSISGIATVAGNYNYSIVTTGNACTVANASGSIAVNPGPSVSLTSSDADNAFCVGTAITFTATSGLSNYIFKLNGTVVQSNAGSAYSSNSLLNAQSIKVIASNSYGCSDSSASIVNTVYPNPTVNLSSSDADNTFCIGTSVTFTASSGLASYQFRKNGSAVAASSGSNAYTSNSIVSGDQIDVVGTSVYGCSGTSNLISNVVENPSISISSSDADNAFCSGTSILFTATASGFSSYNFLVAGSSAQNSSSNSFTTSSLSDGQTVAVIGTTALGCPATSANISNTVIASPTLSLTRTSPASGAAICAGSTATFQATASLANYNFRVDGVSKQNGSSNSYSTSALTDGQVVDVIASNTFGCSTTSAGINNTVETLTPTMTFANPSSCSGQTSTAMSYSATTGHPTSYSYTWTSLNAILGSFANGSGSLNTAPSSFTIAIPSGASTGTYSATLIISNSCGVNPLAGTISLTIRALPTITLSSSDADNSFCSGTSVTFTGTSGLSNYDFKVAGSSVQSSATNTYTSNSLTTGQTVQVTATDAFGCSKASNTITNTVLALPDFTLTSIKSIYSNRSVLDKSVDFYRGGNSSKINDDALTSGAGSARVQVTANSGTTLTNSYDYYRNNVFYANKGTNYKNYADADWGTITGASPSLPAGTSYYTISVRCTSATTACTNTKSIQILIQDIYEPVSTKVYVCTNGTRSGQTVTGTTTTKNNTQAETEINTNSSSYLGACGEVFNRENPDGSISQELVKTDDLLAYPNPFNSQLNLRFFVGNAGTTVFTTVTDVLGRPVLQMPMQHFDAAGVYNMTWDGKDADGTLLQNGIYLIQMRQNDEVKTVRVVLTR